MHAVKGIRTLLLVLAFTCYTHMQFLYLRVDLHLTSEPVSFCYHVQFITDSQTSVKSIKMAQLDDRSVSLRTVPTSCNHMLVYWFMYITCVLNRVSIRKN